MLQMSIAVKFYALICYVQRRPFQHRHALVICVVNLVSVRFCQLMQQLAQSILNNKVLLATFKLHWFPHAENRKTTIFNIFYIIIYLCISVIDNVPSKVPWIDQISKRYWFYFSVSTLSVLYSQPPLRRDLKSQKTEYRVTQCSYKVFLYNRG